MQTAGVFVILFIHNTELLEDIDHFLMPVVDSIVEAVEALRICMIYSISHRALHYNLHNVSPN